MVVWYVCVCACTHLTCCEVPLVVLAEGGERAWQRGEGGHGPLAQGPEAGVKDVDMEDPLAVKGALLSQLQDLRSKLREGGGAS